MVSHSKATLAIYIGRAHTCVLNPLNARVCTSCIYVFPYTHCVPHSEYIVAWLPISIFSVTNQGISFTFNIICILWKRSRDSCPECYLQTDICLQLFLEDGKVSSLTRKVPTTLRSLLTIVRESMNQFCTWIPVGTSRNFNTEAYQVRLSIYCSTFNLAAMQQQH